VVLAAWQVLLGLLLRIHPPTVVPALWLLVALGVGVMPCGQVTLVTVGLAAQLAPAVQGRSALMGMDSQAAVAVALAHPVALDQTEHLPLPIVAVLAVPAAHV
jgi:hypothetical protein